jgi:hypothetical protein
MSLRDLNSQLGVYGDNNPATKNTNNSSSKVSLRDVNKILMSKTPIPQPVAPTPVQFNPINPFTPKSNNYDSIGQILHPTEIGKQNSNIGADAGYFAGKAGVGTMSVLENPARTVLGYASKLIAGIGSLGGLNPTPWATSLNKVGNDYLNPDKSVNAGLNKNLEANPNVSKDKLTRQIGNISYGIGAFAGSAIPYSWATKAAEAIPIISNISKGFTNPIVGKIVQNAVAGTVGMSLVQEPQIVANGMNNKDSFSKISGDMAKDVALNALMSGVFSGVGGVFENLKIKSAIQNFETGKITQEELSATVGKETMARLQQKSDLANVGNIGDNPRPTETPTQPIQGGAEGANGNVAKSIDNPTFTEQLPHANETINYHGNKISASEYANKIDEALPNDKVALENHIADLQKQIDEWDVNAVDRSKLIDINIQFFAAKRKLERILMNAPEGMTVRSVSERIVNDVNQPIDVRKSVSEDFKSFYEVYSDKKAVEEAVQYVAENGNNVDKIIGRLQTGKFNKGDIATAIQIYDNIKTIDPKKASELLAEMSMKATEAGQTAQAFSLLKTMGDDGFDYMVKRQIEKVNKEMATKFGSKFKKIEMDGTVNELLAKRAKATTDEAKEVITDDLSKYIGSRIPSSILDKVIAFRHFAMLANPKTHLRNIVGNTIMGIVAKGKDYVATGIEKILAPKYERTKFINYKLRNPEIVPEVKRATEHYAKYGMGDVKFESGLQTSKYQKTFTGGKENPNIIEKGMQKAVDLNYAALEGEDKLFSKRHFSNSLGQFMSARGLKEATPEAIEFATKQANKLTFRDESKLARKISSLSRGNSVGSKVGRAAVDALIPFKKTPINIFKRTVEYSPYGLVKGITDRVTQVKAGKITATEAVDEIAAGLTGTGVGVLGYFLMANGIITGAADKNAKAASIDKAMGKQPFSIKIGNTYHSYDWASPVGSMLATGAAIYGATSENQDVSNVFLDATAAEMDSLFNSSVFKNVRDTFAGRYGQNISDTAFGIGQSYLLSFIPAAAGATSKTIDSTQRNTYDPNATNQLINLGKNKIPFASKTLPIKYDVFGRPLKNGNAIANFINPSINTKSESDPTINQIYNISKVNSNALPIIPPKTITAFGKSQTIPAKDYANYSRDLGQAQYKAAQELISAPYGTNFVIKTYSDPDVNNKKKVIKSEKIVFSDLSDDQKAEVIRKKYLDAKATIDEKMRLESWIKQK